jgi:hypothetical protein
MKQLHLWNTFKPKHWRALSQVHRQTVSEYHMFLKQKRDGKIKERTIAGGKKQRDYISKEDASSPTVAMEAVLLACIIDTKEGCDVAVVDIPNAFVHMRVENEKDMAFIKIRGVLVDILVEIAPDVYKPYVSKEQERDEAVTGTMPECTVWYNGCKPFVLPQVCEESDGRWIHHQPLRSVRGQQDN